MARALTVLTVLALVTGSAQAQEREAARADYFRAVAAFFNLPPSEIAILSDWEISADEIPVVLFVARRAGVSPEALVALRDGGEGWARLSRRYGVGPPAFHVPVRDDAATGRLRTAYDLFRSTPVGEWGTIRLSDEDIVALVNVRVISQSLGLPAERVLAETDQTTSFVQLYARLRSRGRR